MMCIKTYEYHYSEDEIKQMIVEYWNSKNDKHLPITKSNVAIEFEKQACYEPTAQMVITIKEGV